MKSAIQYLHEILFLMGEDRKKFPWFILLFIISSILDVLGLGIIGPFLAAVLNPELIMQGFVGNFMNMLEFSVSENVLLIFLGFTLIAVFLFKTVISIYIKKLIIRFSWTRHTTLQENLMDKYQKISYTDYMKRNSSDYIQTAHILVSIYAHSVLEIILSMFSQITIALIIISYLVLTDINMISVFILFGLLLFLLDYLLNRNLKFYSQSASDGSKMMFQGIQEGIKGFKEIKILGKANYFTNKVKKASNQFTQNKIKSSVINILPPYLSEFVLVTFALLFIIILIALDIDLNNMIPGLGVVAVAFMRLKPAVHIIAAGVSSLRYGRYATNKIYSDLKVKDEQVDIGDIIITNESETIDFSMLDLKNIKYKYPSADKWVLNNITFTISCNESIGLIGSSGSGKTTLVDVLLGLLEPQSGIILYNDRPIKEYLPLWQQQIAYLPQEIFLLDNTLVCNVALEIDNTKIDEQKVEKALRQARLNELVHELPHGINTMLGESGIRLSGGQRQRVALARAFYHGRNILVMDEATSSLDDETEREIVDEIKYLKGKKTLIIIAHRHTTVQHCDRIYRLEKGRIIKTGSFEEVIKYKELL